MSNRKSSISALLARADRDIQKIEAEYNSSLHNKSVSADLKIDVKNLCENLRSVLDYLAHEMRETCCPSARLNDRFYFPILPDRRQFESQMSRWYPDLDNACPDLWNYLESIQAYHSDNSWLGNFNRLNNENKHADLVEQTRTETQEVRVSMTGGGQVSWNPGAVKFGSGVFIGGVPVDPRTQMPVSHPSQKVEKIIWIDFTFAGIGVSALHLLKQSTEGIKNISAKVHQWV